MVWTGHLSAHLSTIPLPHELSFRGNAECATLEGPENCRGARVRPAQEFVAGLLPSLVIVGRPNVGKSTLFNRLTGTRRSIVTDEPGITRDRIYGKAEWRGRELEIVDTGGIVPDDKALVPQEVLRQAHVAIKKAALLVPGFIVRDDTAGINDLQRPAAP